MKKIPSNNNLYQLKDVFNVNSEITSKIIYSSFIQEMSHEFLDNAPYNIISNIQHNVNNDNTILDSISFGNNTNDVIFGFTVSNYYHMKEVVFCVLLYFMWFRFVYINYIMHENIQKAVPSTSEIPSTPEIPSTSEIQQEQNLLFPMEIEKEQNLLFPMEIEKEQNLLFPMEIEKEQNLLFPMEIETKITYFINLESVKKKMNLILFILFFIFNRNIENAI